jgi:hypothetical protein
VNSTIKFINSSADPSAMPGAKLRTGAVIRANDSSFFLIIRLGHPHTVTARIAPRIDVLAPMLPYWKATETGSPLYLKLCSR